MKKKMFTNSSYLIVAHFLCCTVILYSSLANSASVNHTQDFIQCVSTNSDLSVTVVTTLFTPNNDSYTSILQSSPSNLRFLEPYVGKPDFIFAPTHDSHVRAAVVCAKSLGLNIRVRSGGHDLEGLSYTSKTREPFVLIDLLNLRLVKVNLEDNTAWVQAGATIGEVYYRIARKSRVRGFPAGYWTSLGVGGHITGGAYGSLLRKYGLAADNVVDAWIVDARGRILDREGMGEDVFWAIRGGGGGSFGIILWWKIKLVPVPETVTVFRLRRTLDQGGTRVLCKWQRVADKLEKDVFLKVRITVVNGTVVSTYEAVFLGQTDGLLNIMRKRFSELNLKRSDCVEMSWVQSNLFLTGYPLGTPEEVLLSERSIFRMFFKSKSDFVKVPIPEKALEGLWRRMKEEESSIMFWTPFGGAMSEIPESEIPFPHRKGVIFMCQYLAIWSKGSEKNQQKNLDWIRDLYDYMAPYVSSNPREVYVNYRDLDLGLNEDRNTSFDVALNWGKKYFKDNFVRLAKVKGKFDPENFFWHEQSIPILN